MPSCYLLVKRCPAWLGTQWGRPTPDTDLLMGCTWHLLKATQSQGNRAWGKVTQRGHSFIALQGAGWGPTFTLRRGLLRYLWRSWLRFSRNSPLDTWAQVWVGKAGFGLPGVLQGTHCSQREGSASSLQPHIPRGDQVPQRHVVGRGSVGYTGWGRLLELGLGAPTPVPESLLVTGAHLGRFLHLLTHNASPV